MTKNEAAQKLTHLVSEFGDICPPDEHFSAYCIGMRRGNALKMLDKVIELVDEYRAVKDLGSIEINDELND